MAIKCFSRDHLRFVLYEVLGMEDVTAHEYFRAHGRETFDMILDAAAELAEEYLQPAYVPADREEPQLVDGQVKVHPLVHRFYHAYAESGLMAATFPLQWDGQQLPRTIAASVQYILSSANNSFVMFTDLVKGVANVLLQFGNEEQKSFYLPKLLSGQWAATMCLTESQAGSSLSDITTTAIPAGEGLYHIRGQKIFISAGDQDITENIVHLVLARIEGAPAGVKGISLFIVPKKRQDEAGTLVLNGVESIGIYHKMGQKATPAMHLEFGGAGTCVGYLLGEANRGLQYMFQLMNSARLEVGLAGVSVASLAYATSLQYARERVQGRRANAKDPNTPPVPIIQHPDVRRMLLIQKAITEGTLALILQCYKYLDLLKVVEESQKQHYLDLLELLTPVAKTYGSEEGNRSVYQALQVLGGYGYTTDFPVEQMARDARIFPVYEGTTGIQSIALLGRQIPQNHAQAVDLWSEQVMPDIRIANESEALQPYADQLNQSIAAWKSVTGLLLRVREEKGNEAFLADATLYMQLFGILNVAWQWLRMGTVAEKALAGGEAAGEKKPFYRSKIHTMKFYFTHELTRCKVLCEQLTTEEGLSLFNPEEDILI
ncbi:acyl-CoA dehydrogenase [Telluribacter sp. SYSU D00476]|uniref:acyl-CoA dehydrogenase n=1 Tax=Telluribacter sp. SYSU D00476 TaxID=2811430 RepID=UPI001FF50119|nr:acyl-CoA dehydrogenase [Telluribacter sp. SYSU D00476]